MRRALVPLVVGAGLLVGLEVREWGEYAWGGKADDLAYAVAMACPVLAGLLVPRWRTVGATIAVFAAGLVVEQALWRDDPRLSGIDDMPPIAGLVFVLPMIAALAAIGVLFGGLARRVSAG